MLRGVYRYARDILFATPIPYEQIGTDARIIGQGGKPTLMFLVVGRRPAARTTPQQLWQEPTGSPPREAGAGCSLQDVRSCGTATAVSVPCMFSNLTRRGY